jgi:CDP-diacylglycerol---serine O-phosphatidyltransferase
MVQQVPGSYFCRFMARQRATPPRATGSVRLPDGPSDEARKQLRELTLPNFITLGNAACGFLALALTLHDAPEQAALCIWMSAFLDALDGRVARWTDSATLLGKELDSLADAITFVVVPAFLVYARAPTTVAFLGCASYVCAGIFRLARFNVTASQQTEYFLGVPTTLAACTAAAGLLVLDSPVVLQARAAGMLLLAYLMVSRWRFPTYKNASLLFIATVLAALAAAVTLLGYAGAGLLLTGSYFLANAVAFCIRIATKGVGIVAAE